jgi:N-acyl homoserine lactone hydrolase
MNIHALETGKVAVKTRQREGRGSGVRRLASTFVDREWTQPLPIYAWLIEHPEGLIVVDTGETARAGEPGYFPRWHPYFRLGVRAYVNRDDEIDRRLAQLGFSPDDVRYVVMTHLHTDHAGGLHHFPRSEILVSRRELRAAQGRVGRVRGYLNNRFPDWFAPRPIDFDPQQLWPFRESKALTDAGDITVVPVPGHSHGQLAVVIDEGDHTIFLAGDSSYSENLMLRKAVDGVAPDEAAARDTLAQILSYAHATPTVYLPSHDPESAKRLAARRTVPTEAVSVGAAGPTPARGRTR